MLDISYSNYKKLNFLKKHYILLILLTTFLGLIIETYKNNQLKKSEEKLNNHSDKIERCIDTENNNKRTIYENIKLSEYCIDKFGSIK